MKTACDFLQRMNAFTKLTRPLQKYVLWSIQVCHYFFSTKKQECNLSSFYELRRIIPKIKSLFLSTKKCSNLVPSAIEMFL